MPSPRAAYGRDYTTVTLQYDSTQRTREQAAAYQRERRRKVRSDAIPGRGHGTSGTSGQQPVQIRNGLPFKPYRLPGLDFPGCGCINRASGQRVTGCPAHPLGDDDA